MRWSQVALKNVTLPFIDPDRMVYEVTTVYSRQFAVHGNVYSSGKNIIVVDAATGASIAGMTTGHLIHASKVFVPVPLRSDQPRAK